MNAGNGRKRTIRNSTVLTLTGTISRRGIAMAALLLAGAARSDLSNAVPPSGNFDLSHWKLTLPVDGAGGRSGVAAEVDTATLLGPPGYVSVWFYTAADGAMRFWAPVNGATTDGSSYPRSELREMLDPTDTAVNWTDAGHSVLEAQCAVAQVPSSTGKVVVGQIHGYNTSPLLKLEYVYSASAATGKLVALLNAIPNAASPVSYTLASNVGLNQSFSYAITVNGGVLSMSVNGATATTVTIDGSWAGIGMYFKAGDYVQAKGSSGTDGGDVSFYSLAASHPDNGLVINSTGLPVAIAALPYLKQLSGGGGSGTRSWSLASGRLPQGLSLSSGGLISGTPAPGTEGRHTFVVQLRDSYGDSAARSYALRISPLL